MRLAILLLFPASLLAQELCTLGGIVVNSVTREPVRKAQVYAHFLVGPIGGGKSIGAADDPVSRSPLAITVITDSTGRFLLSNLRPGRYAISAQRSGLLPVTTAPGGPDATPFRSNSFPARTYVT